MKILNAEQLKAADQYTIENEPIKSIDLMERAATACVRRLVKLIHAEEEVYVLCGKGNNGGDGLAIARLLNNLGIYAKAFVINYTDKFSEDAAVNYQRLQEKYPDKLINIDRLDSLQAHTPFKQAVIVDALLGTGANKPAEGLLAEVIAYGNTFEKIVSIDVPSGLYLDKSSTENKNIVRSNLTLTFQLPKLAFLLPENKEFVPEFEVLNIGLLEKGIDAQASSFYYFSKDVAASLLKPRSKFSHKGNFGHALLLAGSKGKSGAALISAKAVLRSGAGLLTLHSTKDTLNALSIQLPEAMSSEDADARHISGIEHPEKYNAIGFGPGVGTEEATQTVLKKLLQYYTGKLVIDADGLNILSENKTWLDFLPPNTILTPHPKEFERLNGKQENDFERLKAASRFSVRYNCILLLKGAHSVIAMPDGTLFFNSSGNAGLAKGGSGDGLTGMILGLLARGYTPPQAALLGTFLHGYASDLCVKKKSMESLLISDVIEALPKAFKRLEQAQHSF